MSWNIDNAHTTVGFSARHMMVSTVQGQFDNFSGSVDFDPQNPAKTEVDVKIAAASINTREPQRDAHLKSPDFLDAENYPYLTFTSKRVEVLSEKRGRLIGDLAIRDVTREVTLEVDYNGMAKNPWGKTVAGFSATTRLNRKDWNLTWNVALETGGWLVSDVIHLNLEVEIVQQELAPAAA